MKNKNLKGEMYMKYYIIVSFIGAFIGGTIGYIRKKKQIEKEQVAMIQYNELYLAALRSTSKGEYAALVSTHGPEKAQEMLIQNYKIRNGIR